MFWGLEELIRRQPGVVNTETGYTGGKNENPTYENHKVMPKSTIARHDFAKSHAEAVEIEYDLTKTFSISFFEYTIQQH